MALVHQREERVSRYAWKHRLYALRVEELPFCMAGAVFKHIDGYMVILRPLLAKIYGFDILF
jgi:hypothetical protein